MFVLKVADVDIKIVNIIDSRNYQRFVHGLSLHLIDSK